ncbi:uncharacterized protein [Branchiostoma lanceolatum]|uniref:uncharacterized protein isoform X2 n=1 Tax=Branchiostoma lanceolatum TaxID=7740 RepID=UPI003456EFF2
MSSGRDPGKRGWLGWRCCMGLVVTVLWISGSSCFETSVVEDFVAHRLESRAKRAIQNVRVGMEFVMAQYSTDAVRYSFLNATNVANGFNNLNPLIGQGVVGGESYHVSIVILETFSGDLYSPESTAYTALRARTEVGSVLFTENGVILIDLCDFRPRGINIQATLRVMVAPSAVTSVQTAMGTAVASGQLGELSVDAGYFTLDADLPLYDMPVDLVFLVDGSDNTTDAEFSAMTSFVGKMSAEFKLGPDSARVMVEQYSDGLTSSLDSDDFTNVADLQAALKTLTRQGGGRALGRSTVASVGRLLQAGRSDVPKIIIAFSTGSDDSSGDITLSFAGHFARQLGVVVYGVALGLTADRRALQDIVGYSSSQLRSVRNTRGFVDLRNRLPARFGNVGVLSYGWLQVAQRYVSSFDDVTSVAHVALEQGVLTQLSDIFSGVDGFQTVNILQTRNVTSSGYTQVAFSVQSGAYSLEALLTAWSNNGPSQFHAVSSSLLVPSDFQAFYARFVFMANTLPSEQPIDIIFAYQNEILRQFYTLVNSSESYSRIYYAQVVNAFKWRVGYVVYLRIVVSRSIRADLQDFLFTQVRAGGFPGAEAGSLSFNADIRAFGDVPTVDIFVDDLGILRESLHVYSPAVPVDVTLQFFVSNNGTDNPSAGQTCKDSNSTYVDCSLADAPLSSDEGNFGFSAYITNSANLEDATAMKEVNVTVDFDSRVSLRLGLASAGRTWFSGPQVQVAFADAAECRLYTHICLTVSLLESYHDYGPNNNDFCIEIPEKDCALQPCSAGICGANSNCFDGDGQLPYCVCVQGYRSPTDDGHDCQDIDECAEGLEQDAPVCDRSANLRCSNTAGGYECNCRQGWTMDNGVCTKSNRLQGSVTLPGTFTPALNNPTSVAFQTLSLQVTVTITQLFRITIIIVIRITIISFSPGSVVANYAIDMPVGQNITDDALTDALSNALASALNQSNPLNIDPGSVTVSDFNECANETTNDCSAFATCNNTVGSFSCACLPGYIDQDPVDDPGRTCESPPTPTPTPSLPPPTTLSVILPSSLQPTLPVSLATLAPTVSPTIPESLATLSPTVSPTIPESLATLAPTVSPTIPESLVTLAPTVLPTVPESLATLAPTVSPTIPESLATLAPTVSPTIPESLATLVPTVSPTIPESLATLAPTVSPTIPESLATLAPTVSPTIPESLATLAPTVSPTIPESLATLAPTVSPTIPESPATLAPTVSPTIPESLATLAPTVSPTIPESLATLAPTVSPTIPDSLATLAPTVSPTIPESLATLAPTVSPTLPDSLATLAPTISPTLPDSLATLAPTISPTLPESLATLAPTVSPTIPESLATLAPTVSPTIPESLATLASTVSPTLPQSLATLAPTVSLTIPESLATLAPTVSPTIPESLVTLAPAVSPTIPESLATLAPTISPTIPESLATLAPTVSPTIPESLATLAPTVSPIIPESRATLAPTISQTIPESLATLAPTVSPTIPVSLATLAPTVSPTIPESLATLAPTVSPTIPESLATLAPTVSPIIPESLATLAPTVSPTIPESLATLAPTISQTIPESLATLAPTVSTTIPVSLATLAPTASPTIPKSLATLSPTVSPTLPESLATLAPTISPIIPESLATLAPTISPTIPESLATLAPTVSPTIPESLATLAPTVSPTIPESLATLAPTVSPTIPASLATLVPTVSPTIPVSLVTLAPTVSPTIPESLATLAPTISPIIPDSLATLAPTVSPTIPESLATLPPAVSPTIPESLATLASTVSPTIPASLATLTPDVSPTIPASLATLPPDVSPTIPESLATFVPTPSLTVPVSPATAVPTPSLPASPLPPVSSAATAVPTTSAPITALPSVTPSAAPVTPSAAPVMSSAAPVMSSAAPVVSSVAPVMSSAAPVMSSTAPVMSSTAPVVSSAAPVMSSAAPVTSSAAPVMSSTAPMMSSAAPMMSSAAPSVPQVSTPAATVSTPTVCTPICGVLASCLLIGGIPQCVCNSGFQGDGFTCRDVNECSTTSACTGPNERCKNREGSFDCVCLPTFMRWGAADNCTATSRHNIDLTYKDSFDYDPAEHDENSDGFQAERKRHIDEFEDLVDNWVSNVPDVDKVATSFNNFRSGSLIANNDVILAGKPLSSAQVQQGLNDQINADPANSNFTSVTAKPYDYCGDSNTQDACFSRDYCTNTGTGGFTCQCPPTHLDDSPAGLPGRDCNINKVPIILGVVGAALLLFLLVLLAMKSTKYGRRKVWTPKRKTHQPGDFEAGDMVWGREEGRSLYWPGRVVSEADRGEAMWVRWTGSGGYSKVKQKRIAPFYQFDQYFDRTAYHNLPAYRKSVNDALRTMNAPANGTASRVPTNGAASPVPTTLDNGPTEDFQTRPAANPLLRPKGVPHLQVPVNGNGTGPRGNGDIHGDDASSRASTIDMDWTRIRTSKRFAPNVAPLTYTKNQDEMYLPMRDRGEDGASHNFVISSSQRLKKIKDSDYVLLNFDNKSM